MAAFHNPTVIDVGVWKGQSTIRMANEMKSRGIDGYMIAVDTFLGSPEHWNTTDHFRREHGRSDLYYTFMSNVSFAKFSEYVVPMAQTSVTLAAILRSSQVVASLVHVDAAHEYEEVIRDAEEYGTLLTSGSILIGNDYVAGWPGVVRAAGEFTSRKGTPMTIEYAKWIVAKS